MTHAQKTIRLSRPDWLGIAVLVFLTIAFFWRMVFTDLILPRGDAFTYFAPYWAYRNASLRMGHIPLWNPYLFMGVPFLANSQAGVLYPPNWLLIPFDAPTAIKVAIVSHAAWAATGAYVFSRRSLNLNILSSTLAATVFALGGYFTSQAEHVNQFQGLAWLPWLFWLWEESLRDLRFAPFLALAIAMQLLAGHTQSAFICGIGLGLWAVWHTRWVWRETRGDAKWYSLESFQAMPRLPIALLIAASIFALFVAAPQMLPTAELTQLSNRSGGLPFLESISFSLRPTLIGRGFLPGYGHNGLFSEYVAYPGIIALFLAVFGTWSGRRSWRVLGLALLAAAGLFLALGAYNPIYWMLVRAVPGFNLFRAPARWLVLWAFAIAELAGIGLHYLHNLGEETQPANLDKHPFLIALALVIGLIAASFLSKFEHDRILGATVPGLFEVGIWLATMIVTLSLIWYLGRGKTSILTAGLSGLAALGTVELFLASQVLPYNHLSDPASFSSQRPSISTLLAQEKGKSAPDRFLSLSDILFDPGDLQEIEAIYGPHLTEEGLYDYIIATKEKEILAPNLPLAWGIPSIDGYDGGILPTRSYSRFTSLFLPNNAVSSDGRLREYLHSVPDPYWLDLASVRYVITDKVNDAWVDGVYYDLQFSTSVPEPTADSSSLSLLPPLPFQATAVGLVGHLEDVPNSAGGSQVGSLIITYSQRNSEQESRLPIRLIRSEGFLVANISKNHNAAQIIGSYTLNQSDVVEFKSVVSWNTPLDIMKLEVTIAPEYEGEVIIRGATLIDERTSAFVPMSLSPNIKVIHSGDVKIYEMSDTLPRAYLVCNPQVVSTEDEMWNRVANQKTPVVVDNIPNGPKCDQNNPGSANITAYQPESIRILTSSTVEGTYLILSDAWYPGWAAEIDEQNTEILHANGLFRAIRLPAGDHQVVFSYRSQPFEIGLVISAISLAVLLGAFFALRSVNQAV